MPYSYTLPDYNQLNPQQIEAISEVNSIALSGGPGTGKSVVLAWRQISNHSSELKSSVLLTYTKSLRLYLEGSVVSQAELEPDAEKRERIREAARKIFLANSWKSRQYDEVIIDEAQDLPEVEMIRLVGDADGKEKDYRRVDAFDPPVGEHGSDYMFNGVKCSVRRWSRGNLRYIMSEADSVCYGADDKQIVYPNKATTEAQLKQLLPENVEHPLFRNYRNTHGILNFAKHTLNFEINRETLSRLRSDNPGVSPILKIVPDKATQLLAALDIIGDFNDGPTNIAILAPFRRQVKSIGEFLSQNDFQLNGGTTNSYSKYESDQETIARIENVHVTTFKSSKGLEFDVVIIPYFESYRYFINKYDVVEEKDYYVAFTRARTNLFLISESDMQIDASVLKREEFHSNPSPIIQLPPESVTSSTTDDDIPLF